MDIDNIHEKTNLMLNNTNSWLGANKLYLNSTEIRYNTFTTNVAYSLPNLNLWFESTSVDPETTIKFLGITFSWNLKWQSYIDQVNTHVSKNIYKIKHLKRIV